MSVTPEMLKVSTEALDVWLDLDNALHADVMELLERLYAKPSDQTCRRAYIRGAWGYIEGGIHGLYHFVRTMEDLAKDAHTKRPAERLGTIDRVKATLKWGSERIAPDWKPDFSTKGWRAVQSSLDLRDRLMHPKSAAQFNVSDEEAEIVRTGMMWFVATMRDLKQNSMDHADSYNIERGKRGILGV